MITSQLPRCRYAFTSRLIAFLNSAAEGAETILIRPLSGLMTLPSNAPVALSTPTLAWNLLYRIVPESIPSYLLLPSLQLQDRAYPARLGSADLSSSGERFWSCTRAEALTPPRSSESSSGRASPLQRPTINPGIEFLRKYAH